MDINLVLNLQITFLHHQPQVICTTKAGSILVLYVWIMKSLIVIVSILILLLLVLIRILIIVRLIAYIQWFQERFIRLATLELGESLVQNARQSQWAVWLLQMVLVPIMKDFANIAILKRRCIQDRRKLAIQYHIMSILKKLLAKRLMSRNICAFNCIYDTFFNIVSRFNRVFLICEFEIVLFLILQIIYWWFFLDVLNLLVYSDWTLATFLQPQ